MLLQLFFSRSLQTTIIVVIALGIGVLIFASRLHLDRLSIDEILDKLANKSEEAENASMNKIVLTHALHAPLPLEKNTLSDESVVVTNT